MRVIELVVATTSSSPADILAHAETNLDLSLLPVLLIREAGDASVGQRIKVSVCRVSIDEDRRRRSGSRGLISAEQAGRKARGGRLREAAVRQIRCGLCLGDVPPRAEKGARPDRDRL